MCLVTYAALKPFLKVTCLTFPDKEKKRREEKKHWSAFVQMMDGMVKKPSLLK
jgi:hypothetical protein